MFHKSELGEHADKFVHDQGGHVPHEGDDWRDMNFDHGAMDPDEEGISEEEAARRTEYLDQVWWPRVIAWISDQQGHLTHVHGESFIRQWQHAIYQPAAAPSGFDVERFE